MKKQIILLFLLVSTSITFAQNPIEWVVYKGGSGTEYMGGLFITDSTYVISASTTSNNYDVPINHGSDDVWFFSISKSFGNIGFNHVFGASSQDFAGGIHLINSSFYITGVTNSNEGIFVGNHGMYDDYLIKTNLNGNLKKIDLFGGRKAEGSGAHLNNNTQFVRVVKTPSYDGNINCTPTINYRIWIYLSDTLGNVLSSICIDSLTHINQSRMFYNKGNYYLFGSGYLTTNKGHTYTDTNGFY